jgi:hypothetical protein
MNDREYARKSLLLRKQRDKQKAIGFAEKTGSVSMQIAFL